MNQIITLEDMKAPASEAYRVLRTNIGHMGIDKEYKIIMITSSNKAEGKTTTITNLATAFAQTGKRILLLDCDLRRPRVHKFFGIPNTQGLSNYFLSQTNRIEDIIQTHKEVQTLDIITTGQIPPMPSELLESNKMQRFLETMREQYDYIFIDSPPVLAVADATILSKYADGILLVVAAGETKMDSVIHAKRALDKVKGHVLGTIMTKAKISKTSYRYDYNY